MSTCLWLTVMAATSCIKQDITVDVGSLRDAGRLDLVEVCTPQDSGLVQAIREDGRQGTRLSIWNGFDLATTKGLNRTLEYLRLHKPRRVWWSPPCTPFSVVQNANQRTEEQVKKLQATNAQVAAEGLQLNQNLLDSNAEVIRLNQGLV